MHKNNKKINKELSILRIQEFIKSLNEKILTLPDEVIVFPGHGSDTSVKYEKMNNPYAKENM